LINRLKPKSEFSRNVLTLMTGTTIAQAIPIAISPILTRLYTPEDFGIFALYISIASLLSVIATGRYELSIMLPKKRSDALNIVILSLIISITISMFAFVIVFIFNEEITILLKNNNISNWLYFIPLTVFFTGVYQSFNYWNNRQKHYNILATTKVIQSSTSSISNLFFGFVGYTFGGMILGSLLGQAISSFILSKKFFKNDRILFQKISKKRIIVLAKKYKKFPLINSLHAFINVLKENAVNIFIAIKYSQATLGYYFFMIRLMKLPAGLLGSSIAQVFYREASEKYNRDKNIQSLVLKLIKKLVLISAGPIILFYFIAEDLFGTIFGKEWVIAGSYAKSITPYIFFHFIASPLGMIPLIVNKQEKAFFWGLFESLLFMVVFVYGYFIYEDLLVSLDILSLIMGLYFIVYFIWIHKIGKASN
jgi:O-antigen/teichoic acid export membrane protein